MDITKEFVERPFILKGVYVYNDENEALRRLTRGEKVARFEYGDSMSPILESGQYCILTPIKNLDEVNVGDAVFCRVNGYLMTHMVMMKSNSSCDKPKFLISNSSLTPYGWTDEIFAIAKGIKYYEKPLKEEYKNQLVDVFLEEIGEDKKVVVDVIKDMLDCDDNYANFLLDKEEPIQIGTNIPLSYIEEIEPILSDVGAKLNIEYAK